MTLLRKALLPTAVALGFLVFLGAIGQGNVIKTASADPETIGICGPETIEEDEVALYVLLVESYEGFVIADLDDASGDSDITSGTIRGEYRELDNPTDFFDAFQAVNVFNSEESIENVAEEDGEGAAEEFADQFDNIMDIFDADFGFDFEECFLSLFDDEDLEELKDELHDDIKDKIDLGSGDIDFGDQDIDCPDETPEDPPFCTISGEAITMVVDALAEAIWGLEFDCDELSDIAEDAYLNSEDPTAVIGAQFNDAIGDQCEFGNLPGLNIASFAAVDVTCEEAGEFDLSFILQQVPFEGKTAQIEVTCVGEIDEIELTATPSTVEIVPALGNTSYSLIVANLMDEFGDPISGSVNVVFRTDRCEFLDEDGLSEADLEIALALFDDFDLNDPDTADDIEDFIDTLEEDHDDVSNDVASVVLTDDFGAFDEDDNVAGIILDCSDEDIAPGIADITAEVDIDDGDPSASTTVKVVGPPVAPLVVAADRTSVICGERVQITVTVKDAAGQPVSDHTLLEAVTNAGGVLGGTGAVAGEFGLVSPLSSTVAETFNGVATFWLITDNETTPGPFNYEILIATGGGGAVAGSSLGGVISTAVVTGRVAITCTGPALPVQPVDVVSLPPVDVRSLPPVTVAPHTPSSVSPPRTGEAGLADASGSSALLFVIAGVAVVAIAGAASVKLARR